MLAAYSKILKCVSFSIYCFFFSTLIPNANNIELRRAVNLSLLHTSKYASIHFIWTEECPFWNALLANVIPFFELLCVFFSYFFLALRFSLVYMAAVFSYVCRERDNKKQKRILLISFLLLLLLAILYFTLSYGFVHFRSIYLQSI